MRETKTIELPVSKLKIDIISFLTLDEYMQLEGVEYQAATSVGMGADGKPLTYINGSKIQDRERLAIKLGVKKITSAEGTEVPVTDEIINNLHIKDGLVLIEAIDAIEGYTKKK